MQKLLEETMALSLDQGIHEGIFPGGISRLAAEGQSTTVARGRTEAGGSEVDESTVYDLASLTKVVATLPLVLLSVQRGRLSLSDPVAGYLPELVRGTDSAGKQKITVFHLLTHTSGLPAWRPYFIAHQGRDAYLKAIAQEALTAAPGQQVVYSDLGFMLLGFLVERIWDESLDRLAQRLVFEPLGMQDTAFNPLESWKDRKVTIAPTEDGNRYECGMVYQFLQREQGSDNQLCALVRSSVDSFGWRQGVIRGTVHDCNAYYGLAGVSGHAGLFSTVGDLERYMHIWTRADGGGLLDPLLRDFAVRCLTGSLSPRRALGWEYAAAGGSPEQVAAGCSGGDLVSPFAFGHTGFTGTSIWHDPVRKATLITLTNRVHPAVGEHMAQWRKRHHNQSFAGLAYARHPAKEEGSR
ncbi:MAG: beta-lactamase family protein [Brevibacillus sp.]|nr:beta-lactamase family protein [Brevibacillus sp.]